MFTDNLKKTAEPVTRFNKLVMDTVGRVGEMQMASFKEYLEIASKQAKSATQIRDYEGLQQYLNDQSEVFSTILEKVSDDMQEISRIADEFREETSELLRAGQEEATAAANESKPAAKKASPAKSA